MWNRMQWMVGAVVLAMGGTGFAQGMRERREAREQEKHVEEQQRACQDLQQFRSSVARLEQAGPRTTVGQLQQYSKQANEDLKRFEKTAKKAAKPEAENVEQMAEKLQKDVRDIPKGATLAQARQMIQSDVELLRMASSQLENKLNCGMGGAGMEGQQGEEKDINEPPNP